MFGWSLLFVALLAHQTSIEGDVPAVSPVPAYWPVPQSAAGVELTLRRLSLADHHPFGVEALDDDQSLDPMPDDLNIDAATPVAAFLDRYRSLDRRFEIRTISGVTVMRPAAAWRDTRNPINAKLTGTFVVNDLTADAVVSLLCASAGRRTWGFSHESATVGHDAPDLERRRHRQVQALRRRVSFSSRQPTVLDVLNRLVVEHGEVGWVVRYSKGQPYLRMWTFYGDGFGCAFSPAHEASDR